MAQIIAGILGGVGFTAFYLALHSSLIIAAVIGLCGYGAGLLIFSPKKKQSDSFISETGGLDKFETDKVIADAQAKVDRLQKLARATSRPESRGKVEKIADIARKIMDDLKEQPGDIKRARQFLNYYLDTTIRILERYTDLCDKNVQSAEVTSSLLSVESLLDSIHAAFEKQLSGLLQDDILDLDTELKLLQNTLKMEGMNIEK